MRWSTSAELTRTAVKDASAQRATASLQDARCSRRHRAVFEVRCGQDDGRVTSAHILQAMANRAATTQSEIKRNETQRKNR